MRATAVGVGCGGVSVNLIGVGAMVGIVAVGVATMGATTVRVGCGGVSVNLAGAGAGSGSGVSVHPKAKVVAANASNSRNFCHRAAPAFPAHLTRNSAHPNLPVLL